MSTIIGLGTSDHKDPFLAATEAAKIASGRLHHRKVSLAILFSTIHLSDKRLLEGITYTLGNVPLIGATGAALIDSHGIRKYGVNIMLIASDELTFAQSAATNINAKGARLAGEEFARRALKNLKGNKRELALFFADGLVENGSDLLRGIKDVFGSSFPIFGGASADNLCYKQTYQFINKERHPNAIVGCVFGKGSLFGIGLRHGWKPLGRPRRITKATGNIIQSIEEKPAISIYEDYFNQSSSELAKNIVQTSIYYPLGLYVPGEKEYLLRNTIRVDKNGGLVCQGDSPAGSDIRLMMGTKEWALEAATKAAQEAKDAIKGRTIKGAIIFESISRSKLLGRLTEQELSRIKEVLGDIPIIGMCTYGEQAPLESLEHYGESYFHNETLAILAIGQDHEHHNNPQ